jgi:predicted NACHT family NTPase
MAKRSLKASTIGIDRAKRAFDRKGWTQEYLAAEVGLSTRQSVWKFFTGRAIERHIFIDLCFQLDLDWQDIADFPENKLHLAEKPTLTNSLEPDNLVSTVRSHLKGSIEAQCRYLQSSFDVTQPLLLESIYTSVSILSNLTNQRWLEVTDLEESYRNNNSDRFSFAQNNQKTIPAIDAVASHQKLAILGKPGAGKTTFLQYIALQCIQGKYKADYIPLFISLRAFATQTNDLNLLNYINHLWSGYDISSEQIETLLQQGKILILLDGLDEIPTDNNQQILQQIQQFADVSYQNQIIVTCRLAAQQYHFQGFTYVELADFDRTQVETFVHKWFIAKANNQKQGLTQATQFLEQLELKENQPIRELVVTPILLSLICSVFQERLTFPSKRAKLYQEGLDILLVRWDRARGIQRDTTYRNLSLPDKIKLLSEIAATTFERGNYFFEKSEVVQIIADYLISVATADADPETLWLNSEAVLKAIEAQHGLLVERAKGIYSFSHLTFQEYLTARKIVASPNLETLNQSLQNLVTHISEPQWREVILLTASILPNADFLLQQMKEKVDEILKKEQQLQQFLEFIDRKVNSISVSYEPSAVRAFYFSLFHNRDLNLAVSIDPNFASNLANELALDLALARALASSLTLVDNPQLKQILNFSFALDLEKNFQITPQLDQALGELRNQLPDPAQGKNNLLSWWQNNAQDWIEQFKNLIIEHRYFGQDWHFSPQQRRLLQKYYNANQFLVECLNSDTKITKSIKSAITATLLLGNRN